MKVFCRNLVAFVLLGTSAEIKAQPRSPNAPRPIAPRKPAAPAPKPVPSKPVAPAPKPVPSKPAAAAVPKPAAPAPKPVPSKPAAAAVPKPAATAPKPVPIKPAAPAPKPVPSKPAAAAVPKPVAPAPKPVPSKPAAAAVPKPAAPAPKPVPIKPAAAVPKPAAPSPGSSCPVIAPYTKPPTAQCGTCYRDMSALTKFLNSTSKIVSATICSGTYAMPATAAFDNSNITSLTLSCCGDAGSCIIDGGAASSTPIARTKRLFRFKQAIILDIQGITFQNFNCSLPTFDDYYNEPSYRGCYGGLLYTESAALVTFKHNYVSKVKSYNYGALGFVDGTFLVFESNTFSDNSAVNAYSYSAGVYIDDSTVFMNGNFFFRNTAWVGGALYFEDSHVEAFCNKFEGNQALKDVEFNDCYGGAISLGDSSLDAKFNQFINNTATGGSGGAIYSYSSQLYFTSNNFSFNTADYGGAVYGEGSGIVTNADSFTKNAATTGNNTALYNAVMKTCPGTLLDVFVDPYSITVVQCV